MKITRVKDTFGDYRIDGLSYGQLEAIRDGLGKTPGALTDELRANFDWALARIPKPGEPDEDEVDDKLPEPGKPVGKVAARPSGPKADGPKADGPKPAAAPTGDLELDLPASGQEDTFSLGDFDLDGDDADEGAGLGRAFPGDDLDDLGGGDADLPNPLAP